MEQQLKHSQRVDPHLLETHQHIVPIPMPLISTLILITVIQPLPYLLPSQVLVIGELDNTYLFSMFVILLLVLLVMVLHGMTV